MRTQTLALAAALTIVLAGGAFAQTGPAPGSAGRSPDRPAGMTGSTGNGTERTGPIPQGNPTQDTTGSIGHPKSTNSSGATTAPAAR